jgi:hypothetical protein
MHCKNAQHMERTMRDVLVSGRAGSKIEPVGWTEYMSGKTRKEEAVIIMRA